jgi:lysophospholipase L1-like esterase
MKILVIGDSWGTGYVAETRTHEGWPFLMGIPEAQCLAVDGSTASQWASDTNGWLTRAKEQADGADVVIMSLGGNDAFSAASDGIISKEEFMKCYHDVRAVASAFPQKRIIVILYTLPSTVAGPFVEILNALICLACAGIGVKVAETRLWLSPDQVAGMPPHPTIEGHKVIAREMEAMIQKG